MFIRKEKDGERERDSKGDMWEYECEVESGEKGEKHKVKPSGRRMTREVSRDEVKIGYRGKVR